MQPSPNGKPLCPFFPGDPPAACTEIWHSWPRMSGNCYERSLRGIIRGYGRSMGSGNMRHYLFLGLIIHSLFTDMIIPSLALHCEGREFFWHITLCNRMLHLLQESHPQGIPQSKRILINICCNHLKLSLRQ